MNVVHVTAVASKTKPSKGERTREKILEAALALFRKKGFDKTTMRDIAKAADMSLGAAYYYFATKDALVLAYYSRVYETRAKRVRKVFEETDDLRERICAMYNVHFDALRRDHKLVGALVRSVADPDSTVSVFADATSEVRNGSIDLFYEAVSVDMIPEELRDLGALGLWTLDLALMLYFIWDESPKQKRTRQLIDDAVDAILPLIPFLALPMAEPMVQHLARLLVNAKLVPSG